MTREISDFRTMGYSFGFHWLRSLFLYTGYVSNYQGNGASSYLTFAARNIFTNIGNCLYPVQQYHLFCGFWHRLSLSYNSICHCCTIGTFHFSLLFQFSFARQATITQFRYMLVLLFFLKYIVYIEARLKVLKNVITSFRLYC